MVSADPVIVWDANTPPPSVSQRVFLWRGTVDRNSAQSILRHVEEDADRLRRRYLAFVHDLGETECGGRTLAQHLDLDSSVSLWWMSLLVEKSYSKSLRIPDCLRLMALEDLLQQMHSPSIELHSPDTVLAKAIGRFCERSGRNFVWQRLSGESRRITARALFDRLPPFFQAMAWLFKYLANHWQYILQPKPRWHIRAHSILISTYSAYMDVDSAGKGRFLSAYWTKLPELIGSLGMSVLWLHKVVPNNLTSNYRATTNLFARFNADVGVNGFHVALPAFLSPMGLLKAIGYWLRGTMLGWRLYPIRNRFTPADSRIDLWPLLREDWLRSVSGIPALENLIELQCFRGALAELPPQQLGLVLREGQAWERIFASAWHERQAAPLVAVIHSTGRFWDLRHFSDPRDLAVETRSLSKQPDYFAINGPVAMKAYLAAGYPAAKLVPVEALRYLSLVGARRSVPRMRGQGRLRVLLLGSYTFSVTDEALRLVEAAVPFLRSKFSFAMKPHPFTPVDKENYPGLRFDVVTGLLGDLASEFDVAFASNITTAALDVYELGLPVIVQAQADGLNLNPLRGLEGVKFVADESEFAAALESVARGMNTTARTPYFYLSSDLRRWRRLLMKEYGGPNDSEAA